MMITTQLYVLELTDGKYYVGRSDTPLQRFKDHCKKKRKTWPAIYPPIQLLFTRAITGETQKELMLHKNWERLKFMERFGWENVRGGDYTETQAARVLEKIKHIYDPEHNKIQYYIQDCLYLFGTTIHYLIFVLELENGCYYIGNTQRLGKAIGSHFNGTNILGTRVNKPKRVLEWRLFTDNEGQHLDYKHQLIKRYQSQYGDKKVIGFNNSHHQDD